MTVGNLLRCSDPSWEMRNIVMVRHECEAGNTCLLQAHQQRAGLNDGEFVSRGLHQYPHKSQLCDRAGCQGRRVLLADPRSHAIVELVIDESERNQGVHIEQINHGKFAKISSTSLLVKVGASGPALKAGSPVAGSVTILTRWGRFLAGVNTIRPASMLASRASPALIPSRRRRGPGSTT